MERTKLIKGKASKTLAAIGVVLVIAMILLGRMARSNEGSMCDIDEKNFPDEYLRNYVLDNFDRNRDFRLSSEEIEEATEIEIQKFEDDVDDAADEDGDKKLPEYKEDEYALDLKGVEWFRNCKKLDIDFNCGYGLVKGYEDNIPVGKLKNADCIYSCGELTELSLENVDLESLDISRFAKLEKLELYMTDSLKKLDGGSDTLSKLEIEQAGALSKLYISKYKSLEKLKLHEIPKLKSLKITSYGLKSLDLSLKLENLELKDAPKLEKVIIGENKELKSLDLTSCPKVTGLTLDGTVITKVKLAEENEINHINWVNNPDLVGFDIENVNPETLVQVQVYADPGLKEIDVRGYRRLESVTVTEKYTRVLKNEGQKVVYN